MSQQPLARSLLLLSRRNQLLSSAPSYQWIRSYSSKGDDADDGGGSLLSRVFRGPKQKQKDEGSKAAADGALVVSGPEKKHHKVFVVELSRKPLFPGIYTPVMINKNEALVKEIMETKKQGGQAYIGAFLKKPETPATAATSATAPAAATDSADATDALADAASHLHDIGTFAQVHTILAGDGNDNAQLLLLGHRRIRKIRVITKDPLKVHIEHLRDEQYANDDILKATNMEIVNTMRDLLQLNPLYGEQFRTLLSLTGSIDLQDMSRLVDAAASLTSADEVALQAVLEQLAVPDRARTVLTLLKKEVELCKLQADIREQVEGKIMKEQRRMLLMEQLKSIKKELGMEKDDKSALLQRFQARWDEKKAVAPPDVAKTVQEELDKLGGLEPASPEFNVTRNYLEWLISLPWGQVTNEVFDLDRAKKVLDDDHYGLEDVKDRIFEFVAVSHLRGSSQGKILCLVGPPGVGKTSIGRSIAHALNRKYYRFSVGGLYDVAEIKGHRRTYVGAMPGKMVQCLKSTQSSNPLVLIDEIDKLGRGHTGDPASALLELLDPEQNFGFLDHYLDVPVDLSKVLFVCTANQLDTIPGPLLDRMEVIRLSGYAAGEKIAIARRYLEPQAATDAGVPGGACVLSDEAMDALINEYCREAGVRNLKKHLEKVYRKAALHLVKQGVQPQVPPKQQQQQAGAAAPAAGSTTTSTSTSQASPEAAASSSGSGSTSSNSSGASASEGAGSSSSAGAEPAAAAAVPYSGPVIHVTKDNLKDYVGKPPFAKDKFYDATPAGVVMGLAWTPLGGATLYVEASKVASSEAKGAITITGQLGEVFRESVSIAHTFARNYLAAKDPASTFFATTPMHVHVPAGATPKDGPSAGCTLVTALLSLALNKPVIPDLAMTGELTLTGCVLPIGGVKEKVLAARRSGVKTLVFPEGNRHEYEELSDDLKQGLDPHFVKTYDEVYALAFNEPKQ